MIQGAQFRTEQLQIEIAGHKAAIRRHRAEMRRAAEILTRLQLSGTGIKPVFKGEGEEVPWPISSTSTP